jgi:hypothetical protein
LGVRAAVWDDPIAIVSGGSNEWKIIAVPGTEATVGSSVAPSLALTSSYIPIATVKVNSSGIVSITDARVLSNHPSLLDTSGNLRFLDMTTPDQTVTASKKFTGGIQRGASGRPRGYTHLVATRTTTYSLANIAIATDDFTVLRFNFINATDDNSPFDFLSLPFSWTGDYVGTMTVQVGQQSGAAQTQPANDNSNNPVRLEVVGIA